MKEQEEVTPYRPKRRPKRLRGWWRPRLYIAVTLSIVALSWFVFAQGGIWDWIKLNQKYDEQAELISQLEAEKQELQKYLDALKNGDEAALERAAREYALVAPGEIIYEIEVTGSSK